ncbi:GNAT family N-acetyltransferase [Undibacterium sp. TS12]|uniref:GNAT family N-acetyltransferase n=1 Tax=Undibacterium sp. TS12 TaxID=2908202 RepID=UPI001F4CB7A9|nr:GNAT family N-acetyltransferase [Undibacterium sp. TS12]MCH8618931.1 GNAT family N-acetyltransferase [Undibacterium sp. TS12]
MKLESSVSHAVPHYRMRIVTSLSDIAAAEWNDLLAAQENANPFLSYAFLHALEESGSAVEKTGWQSCFITIWDDKQLVAALPLYEKSHSYGEYVFDWAWARAYERHELSYYPKLLSAIPFTPVSGNRLLARSDEGRLALINILQELQTAGEYSSSHLLFLPEEEALLLNQKGYLLRSGVQFHWINQGYQSFEDFLSTLDKKKRKNIRSERRKVEEAGIQFLHLSGNDIQQEDWLFFKSCYDQTYREHHSKPYLNLDFFLRIGSSMPEHIHLICALLNGNKIAASLLFHDDQRVYGRYWGCLEQHSCLHFETAYYQAIEFCILKKISIFEGGAQGEHKMARGFLPTKTWSAHHLSHSEFARAVSEFLERETGDVELYLNELIDRIPYKSLKQLT